MDKIKRDFIQWAKNEWNMNVNMKDLSVDEIYVNDVPELNVVLIDNEGKKFFEILNDRKFSFIDAKPW